VSLVHSQTVHDYSLTIILSAPQLGGKESAYVAPDTDLDYTAAELVDGAFFNSGQSSCAIEVHSDSFSQLYLQLTPTEANLRTRRRYNQGMLYRFPFTTALVSILSRTTG
jgi:hypothetical protein